MQLAVLVLIMLLIAQVLSVPWNAGLELLTVVEVVCAMMAVARLFLMNEPVIRHRMNPMIEDQLKADLYNHYYKERGVNLHTMNTDEAVSYWQEARRYVEDEIRKGLYF